MYSTWVAGNKGGESETIIGNWLKRTGKRHQVIIATKLGNEMGTGRKGLSKKYARHTAVNNISFSVEKPERAYAAAS